MKKLFTFDVTLKELMNLEECSKRIKKLAGLFFFLKGFWYELDENHEAVENKRWNNIRVGSVDVYLDEEKNLCLKFVTRFSFEQTPEPIKVLEHILEKFQQL